MRPITLTLIALILTGCAGQGVIQTDGVVLDTGDEVVQVDEAPCAIESDELSRLEADFGRDDITVCETSSYKQLLQAEEACNADGNWHVCTESEFVERNSYFWTEDATIIVATLDSELEDPSKDTCGMYNVGQEGAWNGSVDGVKVDTGSTANQHDSLEGTCSPDVFSDDDVALYEDVDGTNGRRNIDLATRNGGPEGAVYGVVCCL